MAQIVSEFLGYKETYEKYSKWESKEYHLEWSGNSILIVENKKRLFNKNQKVVDCIFMALNNFANNVIECILYRWGFQQPKENTK